MTKSSPNLIKKFFFTVAGFEHRDFASRYALTQGISLAFNDKILNPKNCVFGFEKSYDSAQKISVAMPGFNQLIKQKGFNTFQSSVFNPAIDDLAGFGPGTEVSRMSIIDTLATLYMRNFCRDHGIKNSQLESDEVAGKIDADMNHLPLGQEESNLPKLDKLRVEAMMKNIQMLTSSNQEGVVHATLIVGAAHVPVITAECLSLFNGPNKVAKVAPILLLSDQAASEMGTSSYGEALNFIRNNS